MRPDEAGATSDKRGHLSCSAACPVSWFGGQVWVSVGRRGADRFGAGQAAAAGGPRAATATRSRRIVAALAFANGRLAWTMSPGLRSDRRYVSLAVTGQGTALASRFE